ncbi:MAG: hypothetical protein ACTSU3_07410 [Candidatus Thorarchaeota archaeon]
MNETIEEPMMHKIRIQFILVSGNHPSAEFNYQFRWFFLEVFKELAAFHVS